MRRFVRVTQLAWTTSVQAPASRPDPRAPPNEKFAVQYTLAHLRRLAPIIRAEAAAQATSRGWWYLPYAVGGLIGR